MRSHIGTKGYRSGGHAFTQSIQPESHTYAMQKNAEPIKRIKIEFEINK